MSRKSLEIAMSNLDMVHVRADRVRAMLEAVLEEGGKRPKLTADERESILSDMDAIEQDLEEALEEIGKA